MSTMRWHEPSVTTYEWRGLNLHAVTANASPADQARTIGQALRWVACVGQFADLLGMVRTPGPDQNRPPVTGYLARGRLTRVAGAISGTEGEIRTPTGSRPADFESHAGCPMMSQTARTCAQSPVRSRMRRRPGTAGL